MRIRIFRGIALVLVMALILSGSFSAAATEPEETVPAATEATVPETEVPEESIPEETLPEEEPKVYTVDTESEMYKVLDALAPELKSDQILVYDATDDEIREQTTAWFEKHKDQKVFTFYKAIHPVMRETLYRLSRAYYLK